MACRPSSRSLTGDVKERPAARASQHGRCQLGLKEQPSPVGNSSPGRRQQHTASVVPRAPDWLWTVAAWRSVAGLAGSLPLAPPSPAPTPPQAPNHRRPLMLLYADPHSRLSPSTSAGTSTPDQRRRSLCFRPGLEDRTALVLLMNPYTRPALTHDYQHVVQQNAIKARNVQGQTRLWRTRSRAPSTGALGGQARHGSPKPPGRRWFSTIRPPKAQAKDQDCSPCPSNQESLGSQSPPSVPSSGWPVVHRRRSLTNAFQSVKAKCSRDKLSDSDDRTDSGSSSRQRRPSRISKEMISSPIAAKPMVDPPPRLDVLSELPQDGLHRSSTFRACLEKAVEDINNKYGASSTSCLPDNQTYATSNGDRVTDGYPTSYHARSNFQPRYRLPTFVHVPLTRAQPTVGEVKDISPCSSNETTRLGQAQPGSVFSERQIDEILDRALDMTSSLRETATGEYPCDHRRHGALPGASPSPAMPSSPPSVAIENNGSESDDNGESKLGTSEYNFTGRDTKGPNAQLPHSSNADSIPATFPHGLDDRTHGPNANAGDTDTNSIHIQFQQRPSMPELDAQTDISVLAMKRIRCTFQSPKACTKAEFMPPQRTRAQGGKPSTGTREQRAPSVSELVSKFRRMASPPNEARQEGAAEEADARMLGTCRSRFSNDSEDDSFLISNADDAKAAIHRLLANKRRIMTNTDGSGDDDVPLE
ncbi:Uncharacterized protein TCAP_02845 [Tolypocladium capitatum]|uniref:Uncharacterized protein n=1 Tax=Tolypocladium capitatum TaxID=45235 RepID=A0A2K3QI75_9HYPO|nr:Uncharacterized protein TCAP_02845 [Tolypocladium capitatum]